MQNFWARLTVHWHVLAVSIVAALPSILDWLGVVDLKPILSHVLPENYVSLIIGVMPFVLAFLKPLLAVEAPASQAAPTEAPK